MKNILSYVNGLLDNEVLEVKMTDSEKIDVARIVPFILMHLSVFLVIFSGFSWAGLALCAFSYLIRMFAITAFYHRYFSHKTFKTSRPVQFFFAFLACSSTQRGPIWWAAHHRQHHKHSDQAEDTHSPVQHSFWWSHMGWFLCQKNFPTNKRFVQDWLKFKELNWLNRYDWIAPVIYALFISFCGWICENYFPALGLTCAQALVWGFFVSTVILYHGTFLINSLSHVYGTRPFETKDESRNNPWLAIITLGEGWHNNHHYFPNTIRQGFRPGEFDPTYWGLWLMAKFKLIHSCRELPAHIKKQL
jgi:stearoyl-CoA desaturase (Delta-9 desaturase)